MKKEMSPERMPLNSWEQTDGWIYHWLIAGFFPSGLVPNPDPDLFEQKVATRWTEDFLGPWGGEANLVVPPAPCRAGQEGEWWPVSLVHGPRLLLKELRRRYADLDDRLGPLDSDGWNLLWYACAVVESDRDMECVLNFCGWDGCRLRVNGELVFDEHSYHHVILEKEALPIRLKRGRNTLLFKLDRDGCAARLSSPSGGTPDGLSQVAFAPVPPPPRYSTMEQLRNWAHSKQVAMPFTGHTPSELAGWQRQFKAHYLRCLGPWPETPPGEAGLLSTERLADGVERRLYELPCEAGGMVPFYVMRPPAERDRRRVIVVAHGHDKDWREVAGVVRPPRAAQQNVGSYTGDYALQMAGRGWTTVVCCQRGFGERNDHRGPGDKCDAAAWLAMAQGYTYIALHLHDMRRVTAAALGLPENRAAGKPGLMGLSGGGTIAYLLAAADESYAATALFCCVCRYRDYALWGGCGMQVLPLLYPTGDVGEVLSLMAPRPLLIGQGRLDKTFNVPTVRSVHADAMRAYRAAGRAGALRLEVYERAHQVDVEAADRFFAEALA